ncbi:hypothetical protein P3X46_034066 [Hevea brasiliensis]|uniref:Uncharacterized protein n=1 Tax=Hevea brasiliensis TaxID=3981 RepID=A0ABQ9KA79_HEVBR|nr:hypothetical protein P3X46_034066 [Hevea brasiliensis]
MRNILGITYELSQTLQRKYQDIVNAMTLVKIAKQRLQSMRDEGWNSLFDDLTVFCSKHNIEVPSMDDMYVLLANMHHYQVQVFYAVIDLQLQELNNHSNEVNTELLLCVACLSQNDSFSAFDKEKLLRFTQFYPIEFSIVQLVALDNQLETYILDIKSNAKFSNLIGISNLAEKMVKTKRNVLYPLVYRLITLTLILLVAIASVERAFLI